MAALVHYDSGDLDTPTALANGRTTVATARRHDGTYIELPAYAHRLDGARIERNYVNGPSDHFAPVAVFGADQPTITKSTYQSKDCIEVAYTGTEGGNCGGADFRLSSLTTRSGRNYVWGFRFAISRLLTGTESLFVRFPGDASPFYTISTSSGANSTSWQFVAWENTAIYNHSDTIRFCTGATAYTSAISFYITDFFNYDVTGRPITTGPEYIGVDTPQGPELFSDPTFQSGTGDLDTISGTSAWSQSAGSLEYTGTSGNSTYYDAAGPDTLVTGQRFVVEITLTTIGTNAQVTVELGAATGSPTVTTTGTHRWYFSKDSNAGGVGITVNSQTAGTTTFTNLSVKDALTGLNATGVKAYDTELNSTLTNDVLTFGAPGASISHNGLVWEPQDTNLIHYHQDLSQSFWTKTNVTIATTSSSSPLGDLEYEMSETTANNYHCVACTITENTDLKIQAIVKKGTRRYCFIGCAWNGSNGAGVQFDFDSEAFSLVGATGPGYSAEDEDFFDLGSGWFLIKVTIQSSDSQTIPIVALCDGLWTVANVHQNFYSGTVTENLLFGGIHISAPSDSYYSFIRTNVGATVTRNADDFDLSASLGTTTGTIAARVTSPFASTDENANSVIVGIDDGGSTAPYGLLFDSGTLDSDDDGSVTPSVSASWTASQEIESVLRYSDGDSDVGYAVDSGSWTWGTTDTDTPAYSSATLQFFEGWKGPITIDEISIQDVTLPQSVVESGNWSEYTPGGGTFYWSYAGATITGEFCTILTAQAIFGDLSGCD